MRKRRAITLLLALLSASTFFPPTVGDASAQTVIDSAEARRAYRFLAEATFGARAVDVRHLATDLKSDYQAWINEQTAHATRFSYVETAKKFPCSVAAGQKISAAVGKIITSICPSDVSQVFWLGAVLDSAQLRQRVAFALSQIFVISVEDGALTNWGNASAAYADVLYRDAFANFRTLLEDVTRSDAMGKFLSYLYNTKGAAATASTPGTVPDQNFAREVMQLFTIGLVQLDSSGRPVLDTATGKPIPTYSQNDVVGASNVMTGFGPRDLPTNIAYDFKYGAPLYGREDYQFSPIVAYPQYHATIEKRFLGVTIPASSIPNPDGDLKVFLDTLFHHSNVGPFIGKQLIQRLVTSNPSPAYVHRVAAVFVNNGAGVRGDLAAVVRAVLVDPEARSDASVAAPTFGKIREPILRMSQLLRVFNANPGADGTFGFNPYDSTLQLGQYPFLAGSVFNFYYPDFTPPLSALASKHLVSPEMQITTTETVYRLDQFLTPIFAQAGWYVGGTTPGYLFTLDYRGWLPLVASGVVVDDLNLVFLSGQMSSRLRSDILAETAATTGGEQAKFARALRVLFASPEYIVQK